MWIRRPSWWTSGAWLKNPVPKTGRNLSNNEQHEVTTPANRPAFDTSSHHEDRDPRTEPSKAVGIEYKPFGIYRIRLDDFEQSIVLDVG
jgi:hypothetical protein